MELTASRDDRIRDLIKHHGARTGRPTGEGAQPLNMPRDGPSVKWCGSCNKPFAPKHANCPHCFAIAPPKISKWSASAVPHVLEIMATRSLDAVEFYYGDATLAIAGCLRGLFVAAPGKELIASDYSAIEAVVIAMLAGEQWRIDAFREGKPIYLLGASKITGVPLDHYLAYHAETGDHHPDRQSIGKVSELACFAAETKVLTKRGYVGIVDVTSLDSLWDGEEWVQSQGTVYRGKKRVVNLGGVKTTPNHLINCNGFWTPAKLLVSNQNTHRLALATALVNLPLRASIMALPGASFASACLARAARLAIAWTRRTYEKAKARVAMCALKKRAGRILKSFINMPTLSRMMNIVAAFATELRRVLRGANRRATPIMAGGESLFMKVGSPIKSIFYDIWLACRVGTTRFWNWTESIATGAMNRAIFALLAVPKILETKGLLSQCKKNWTGLEPVYDVAFAGPRNTYTVLTNDGPLLVHNCGFGGWIGSYKAFGSTAPDDEIKRQILAWREASPAIVEFWGGQFRGKPWDPDARQEYYGVEGCAIQAILYPDVIFDYKGIKFFMRDRALIIKLLSGRELTYHDARVTPAAKQFSRPGEYALSYMTWNSNPKYGAMGWVLMDTYGGRLVENIVQATAHDILRHAILNLRAHGYPTVLHVYDEIVVEVPEGLGSVEDVEKIMMLKPLWAADWPIVAAGGWRGRRYRKG